MTETRKNSGWKAFKLVAGVAVLLFGFVGVWFYVRGASEIKIAIKFVGITNNAAAFVVSNEGRGRAFQWGQFSYQMSNDRGVHIGGDRINALMLGPGQTNVIQVPFLSLNQEPWRVALYFSHDDWRHKLAIKPPWVQDMVRSLIPISEKKFMEKSECFYSEWIGPNRVTTHIDHELDFPRVYISPPKDRAMGTNGEKKIELRN